jgi:hypothetical protein
VIFAARRCLTCACSHDEGWNPLRNTVVTFAQKYRNTQNKRNASDEAFAQTAPAKEDA